MLQSEAEVDLLDKVVECAQLTHASALLAEEYLETSQLVQVGSLLFSRLHPEPGEQVVPPQV